MSAAPPGPGPGAQPAPAPADVLREVDADARALARRLLTDARHGALAVIEAGSGHPAASRVAIALDEDGAPIILTSTLAAHTAALLAEPRCSLLLGEPGAGDPLAHPRMTLFGLARRLARDSLEGRRARERYLLAHPRAALYADFADFAFWRIEPLRASLNGGFGRAWVLQASDLAPG
jgi:putative heme iron utilization protein